MRITRAHLNKNQTLTFSYERTDEKGIKWTVENQTGSATVHPDLTNALNGLTEHVIRVCKFQDGKDEFSITCINIKEKEESDGIVISGTRKCGKRPFNFNTPYIKLDDDDYEFSEDLGKAVELIVKETRAYMTGEKFTTKQAELELEPKKEPVEGV